MKISVVIPTYNRLDSLKRVFAALEKQSLSFTDFEVIVVSDGAADGTNDYLRTFNPPYPIKPIFQTNTGVAAARNAGIQAATGDLLLFLDDDVVPTPELLAQHLNTHSNFGESDTVVVLGPMLTPPDFEMAPWVQWEQTMLVKQYEAMHNGEWEPTARQFFTGNTSLAKRHLLMSGGFDTRFRRAEDVELAYRLADAGLKFVFNGQAVGYHYAERSFDSWLNTPYAYGVNDVIFAQEKGQIWLLPVIWREFRGRNSLVRGMTNLCLGRPLISKISTTALAKIALFSHKLHQSPITNMAFSGIFNLRYYEGVADQLGGRDSFFKGLNQVNVTKPVDQHTNSVVLHDVPPNTIVVGGPVKVVGHDSERIVENLSSSDY